ncbi:MAG TPA: GAF domain-containing protein [Gemmataceae bacterium]|nr:GAF domain-containing protein [Gemmataceae bacterium]
MSQPSAARHPLLNEVEALLASEGATAAGLGRVLDRVLTHFGGAVGTIHFLDPGSQMLLLRAQRGIPDQLAGKVGRIPVGKGMAGLAAQRREPVQVCNLQTDDSGVARPAARETRMEGSIAVPMFQDGAVRGVLGIAKPVVHEFSPAETALLQEVANTLGKYLA